VIRLHLNRDFATSYCTMGQLSVDDRSWPTIERPWAPSSASISGMKGASCVPLGDYRVTKYNSDAHPNVFALSSPKLGVYVTESEVPPSLALTARTRVLIHPANWASELRGCVAPGKQRAKGPDGLWMVKASRDAMNEIRNALSRSVDVTLLVTSGGVIPEQEG
jgi:hypothetical protein